MRKLLTIAALAAFTTSMAAAQSRWTPEIGIQGGYNHIKPAGTGANDALNLITIPGSSFVSAVYGSGAFFAIIPAGLKLAVEPQFAFSQVETGGSHATIAKIGLRADYAFNANLYAAAGGQLAYLEQGSNTTHTQLGAQVAVGYRKPLTSSLNARLEANVTAMKRSNLLPPFDAYQVLLGVSSSLRPRAARARSAKSSWDPMIGVSGGYFAAHQVGGSNVTGIAFPAFGGDGTTFGITGAAMPTLFAIIPMGQKLALEPGVDFTNVSQTGSPSQSTISVSGRLDYAVTGNWYAAAGGVLNHVSGGGTSSSLTGLLVAWGYRFHLAGAFGGRFEANYLQSGKNTTLGLSPMNTLGLSFGLMMPLK